MKKGKWRKHKGKMKDWKGRNDRNKGYTKNKKCIHIFALRTRKRRSRIKEREEKRIVNQGPSFVKGNKIVLVCVCLQKLRKEINLFHMNVTKTKYIHKDTQTYTKTNEANTHNHTHTYNHTQSPTPAHNSTQSLTHT